MRARLGRAALIALCLGAAGCSPSPPDAATPIAPTPQPAPAPAPVTPPPAPPAIPLPPGAPGSTTTFSFTSDQGDWIGQGLSRTYYLGDGSWNAKIETTATPSHVRITIENFTPPNGTGWEWGLDFAPPKGQTLKIGAYDSARGYPFQPDTQPGLDVEGVSRGCNTLTGRFVVTDISVSPAGALDRFAATFDQNCEGGSPALHGKVVIASNPWR